MSLQKKHTNQQGRYLVPPLSTAQYSSCTQRDIRIEQQMKRQQKLAIGGNNNGSTEKADL